MGYIRDVMQLPQLVSDLQGHYMNRNNLLKEMRNCYFMKPPNSKPANTRWIQSPTGHNAVNMFVDMLNANYPIMKVPARGPAKDETRRAAQTSRFLKGLWERSERRIRQPLFRYLYWSAAVYGYMVTKVLYDPTEWGAYPQPQQWEDEGRYHVRVADWYLKRPTTMPVRLQVRNPMNVMPQPVGTGEMYNYVVEVYQRRVADIRAVWGAGVLPNRLETDIVEWVEYWDKQARAYMADGIPVSDLEPHGYNLMNYIIGRAYPLPESDPEYQGVSILYAMADMVNYESELLSQQGTAISRYSWPTVLARWNATDPKTGTPVALDLRPGAINYLDEDEKIEYLEWQGQMPALNDQQATISKYLERAGFPSIIYGEGLRAGASGRLLMQALQGTKAKVGSAKSMIEWVIEDTNEAIFKLIESVGEGVSVWTKGDNDNRERVTLHPDDIDGYYDNVCSIQAQLPEDALENAAIGERLVAAGIISKERARTKYAGVEDAVEEGEKILLEQIEDLPVSKLWAALKIVDRQAKELGPLVRYQLKQAIQNAFMAAAGQAPGMSAGGGPAGMPSGMPNAPVPRPAIAGRAPVGPAGGQGQQPPGSIRVNPRVQQPSGGRPGLNPPTARPQPLPIPM